MAGWPTLIIHFSQPVRPDDGDENQVELDLRTKLDLTLLDDQTTIKSEAGEITLPFPREVIPYLHYSLNSRQNVNNTSQANQTLEKPPLDATQEEILLNLHIIDEFTREANEDLPKVLGGHIGYVLKENNKVRTCLEELFSAASNAGGGDIVLRFGQNALLLSAIPWELTYYGNEPLFTYPGEEAFLGYTRMIVYDFNHRANSSSTIAHPAGEKIRLLAASSHAQMDTGGIRLEQQAREALEKAVRAYDVVVDPLEYVSISKLKGKFSDRQVDILNYWGHGVFKDGHAILLMNNDDESPTEIPASQFKTLPQKPPVVILLACHTAQVDICHPEEALPILLNKDRVQVVVAMQFAVRMEEVTETIIPTLYGELVKQQSVQRAVAQVRKDLFTLGKEGWYVPVLYLKQNSQDTTDYRPYVPFAQTVPTPNPFASKIIADSKRFVGRAVEVRKMWDRLREDGSFAIEGLAGAGKTSMLGLIRDEGPEKLKSESGVSPKIIWVDISQGMKVQSIEERLAVVELGGKQTIELIQRLNDNHVILLLDYLDKLASGEADAGGERDKLLEWLSTLLNHGVQIVATLRQSFNNLFPQYVESPLGEALSMPIKIGTFSKTDARSFIEKRLADTNYSYDEFKDLVQQKEPMTPRRLRKECYDKFEELSNTLSRR